MTVAFHDVVILSKMLGDVLENGHSLGDWERVTDALHNWFWKRKELAATVNVLSVALYDLFGANGDFYFSYFAVCYLPHFQMTNWTF